MFKKYMHIERYGNDEVQGIELGSCHIFPKIDGTNASLWINDDLILCAGSRRRQLSLDEDNAGFFAWASSDDRFGRFFSDLPSLRLFGEWLVPHSLKTYREDAWRKFYVFDVYDDENEKYIPFPEYEEMLRDFYIDYIPPMSVAKNATYDNLLVEMRNNVFLIQEGAGQGEGIVIKNYQYENRFGRLCYAKIVTNEFKEKHTREMGATHKNFKEMAEQKIVDKYITKHFVDKVYSKITNECEGWNSKYIPRLFETVYYDLVNEEIWNIVKKMKRPTINFKTLYSIMIIKIKEIKPELF